MQHAMIDLETLGPNIEAPVIALAAVFFNPNTGEIGKTFYERVDFSSALKTGKPSGDTFKWWLRQPDAARQEIVNGTKTLAQVLEAFVEFLSVEPDVQVWGNGATFDISILEVQFARVLQRSAPWMFRNIRDCRTIRAIALGVHTDDEVQFAGVKHCALHDAIYQARWVSVFWQKLRGMPVSVVGLKEPTPEPAAATASEDPFDFLG